MHNGFEKIPIVQPKGQLLFLCVCVCVCVLSNLRNNMSCLIIKYFISWWLSANISNILIWQGFGIEFKFNVLPLTPLNMLYKMCYPSQQHPPSPHHPPTPPPSPPPPHDSLLRRHFPHTGVFFRKLSFWYPYNVWQRATRNYPVVRIMHLKYSQPF